MFISERNKATHIYCRRLPSPCMPTVGLQTLRTEQMTLFRSILEAQKEIEWNGIRQFVIYAVHFHSPGETQDASLGAEVRIRECHPLHRDTRYGHKIKINDFALINGECFSQKTNEPKTDLNSFTVRLCGCKMNTDNATSCNID